MMEQNKHRRLFIGLAVIAAAFGLVLLVSLGGNSIKPEDVLNQTPTPTPTQTPSPNPTPTPNPTPASSNQKFVLIDVPFFSQAPNANWDDPRQQDGCEEASVLMAWLWVNNKTMTKAEAEAEIVKISHFEEDKYGNYVDTSAQDTARFFQDFYDYKNLRVDENITIEDIKDELRQGRIVLVPANGQKLGNPNFTGAGPYTHMVVVRGFDEAKEQVITNDPGTRNGREYRYDYDVFYNAMVNYPSGDHLSQDGRPKAMITVWK